MSPQPPFSQDIFIKDGTDASFMTDVIEASQEHPVIVDFWAPWCQPCRQLTPVLESEVQAVKGKVTLVKINIDENSQVAAQLRVQALPAVFAFIGGRPVDGFMEARPASQIKEFIAKLIAQNPAANAGEPDIEGALEAAEAALEQGVHGEAAQIFASVLNVAPENIQAIAGMARCYAANGAFEQARGILDILPEDKASDAVIVSARANIELAEQAQAKVAALEANRAKLADNPQDHQARYDLALALVSIDDRTSAIEELLELFRQDREWNDGAAKAQLFKLFEAFGPQDPVTLMGRRRLSSLIFT